ncbi:MAG: CDP-alcohol phosphatidyltransferase family protein [Candidatus Krumholzibacteria bacterium]|jgi:CDP-diacylglycerol--glycerol-3-phosphate 3-phosphatidyltransferase|nr:CDP-alcohol phosphatidyltransferase family protein [Candidatus Krumholzibacteria bacterium]MDP6668753.1 CDP-alcohol phosphatidyltransferase family protein [Candidatus Krumholzibacteria bacterium]MDP6797504.1 CDP-alcohol phosphatidyltransferase family protein [Candidatus Krumholzibacteria bacterium]MDP7021499.1 CDP-alcohol phosphatidyltransferase family protein [Candidatus Krumholzibacteria bacterium]
MLKTRIQNAVRFPLEPLARFLLHIGLTPNAMTMIGLVLSLAAGYSLIRGQMISAAWLLLFGGICDILDGSMARSGGRETRQGAFLDSTLDRLGEIAIFLGLLVVFAGQTFLQFLVVLALSGSLMTSYARARAEGLGLDAKVGLLERPERVVLLILALFFPDWTVWNRPFLIWVLWIMALLTWLTTLQRMVHVLVRNHE